MDRISTDQIRRLTDGFTRLPSNSLGSPLGDRLQYRTDQRTTDEAEHPETIDEFKLRSEMRKTIKLGVLATAFAVPALISPAVANAEPAAHYDNATARYVAYYCVATNHYGVMGPSGGSTSCPIGSDFYIGRVSSIQQIESKVVFTAPGDTDTAFHYMGNGNSWKLTSVQQPASLFWSIQGDPQKTVDVEMEGA
jgi:hypothetical protein